MNRVAAIAYIVFNLLYTGVLAQELDHRRDSLRRALMKMPSDTNKVARFLDIGELYNYNIPDSAAYYYEQARKLSEQLAYPQGFVRYVNYYTEVLNMQGKYEQSLGLLTRAADTCRRYQLERSLNAVLGNIGAVYQYQEKNELAIEYYLKTLAYWERTSNDVNLAVITNNLCGLYRVLNQNGKALQYGRRALALSEKLNVPFHIANACINVGNALVAMDSVQEAIPYYQRTYSIARSIDDLSLQETALIDLGNTYESNTQPEKYYALYAQALPLTRKLGNVMGECVALRGMAEGLYWQKKYRQAERLLDTAIDYALRNEQKSMASGMLLVKSDIQIALGRPEMGVPYRAQYDALKDSSINEGLAKNVQELETKYQVEKKQHEILEKDLAITKGRQESQRQRWLLLLSSAGLLVLGMLLYLSYRQYQHRMAEQRNLQLISKLEGQEQERKRISQEMHDDMGSGLTSMLFLSRTVSGPGQTVARMQHTAKDLLAKMNEIIWAMNPGQDSLDSLLGYMRVHTAELLENAGIDHVFQMPEPIPDLPISQEYRRNIYLVAKEAVHNVIKHANATQVVITVQIGPDLRIDIRDNGEGFDPAAVRRFGNGLTNQRERMTQIGGNINLTLDGGTCVKLEAPLPL